MVMRELGLLAACFVLPISALNFKPIVAVPARATDKVEQDEKSANGVNPRPTSQPELVGIELLKRADYSLPTDYCGWYADYKSASYTCALRSASCINVGSYRGCCNSASSLCASTFYSACIPAKSLTSAQSCGKSTICCSNTNYPECGTILFSSSAESTKTYTNIDCWTTGFGTTYAMQDIPPWLTDTTTTPGTSSTTTSIVTTSTPSTTLTSSSATTSQSQTQTPDPSPSAPIGAIVGGVVGGIAVIGAIAIAIFFILRKKKEPPAAQIQPPHAGGPPQMGQVGTPPVMYTNATTAPGYDPRYSQYPQQNYQVASPDPNAVFYGHQQSPGGTPFYPSPTSPGPNSPDPIKMAGNTSPVQQNPVQHHPGQHHPVHEAPATNPAGHGNNAAELA